MKNEFAAIAALVLFACLFSGALASEPALHSEVTNATNDTVKFVVFSDPHIGLNETNNTYKMFHYGEKIVSDMVNEVEKMNDVSFVLIAGDLTKDSEPKNHKMVLETLSKLNKTYYITPGNHDVMKKGMPKENWGVSDLIENYPMPWRKDSLSYSVDVAPGLHLISLDSSSHQSHFDDWGGATSKEDLEWLEQDLANNTGKTILLVTHHALNHHEGVDNPLYYNDNSSQIKRILDKYGVHLAITGHLHVTDIAKNGSLTEMTVPSTSTYPLSYTIWQLSPTQAQVHTVWYKNQTLMNISKQEFINAKNNVTLAEGEPSDRDAIIDISNNSTAAKAEPLAKNVILMIGDGMGQAQVTAARWEKAGENLPAYRNTTLNMDHMDYFGYVTTYSANTFVTDSAAAITAICTGSKTINDVINQDATAVWKERNGKNLTTITEMAKNAGYATGAVSTTRFTHATPAGFYAHINNRDNEASIAEQFLASKMDVGMGGGYKFFVSKNQTTPFGAKGKRTDNRDLVSEAKALGYTFVYNDSALMAVNASSTKMLLGLFNDDHMLYELQRSKQTKTHEPSLAEMTKKAIEVLSQNPKGFILMVEGGRIDHAGHARSYDNMTNDTLAFDEAVKVVQDFRKMNKNTLLIITADHETGGLNLGAKNYTDYTEGMTPFFGTGLIKIPGSKNNYTFASEATHNGIDVPIMATGPGAESVTHGMMDNTQIFEIMKQALEI